MVAAGKVSFSDEACPPTRRRPLNPLLLPIRLA